GEVARTLVTLSGAQSVHGIIPAPLVQHERGPNSETEESDVPAYDVYGKTTVVKDMHQRKEMMAKEVIDAGAGSGFVALSGGYGTLEELMEVVTWNQLGIHERGVCVLNVEGYWDGLLRWVEGSVEAGFVGAGNRGIMGEAKSGEEAVEFLRAYKPSKGGLKLKWGNE
ncbi:Bifunctional cytokinin biosynthesis protein, partial [Lachnellula arida]